MDTFVGTAFAYIGGAGSATPTIGNFGIITYTASAGNDILAWGAQLELVSGQDDPSPSEYQATTTAAVSKWYANKRRTNLFSYSQGFDNAYWTTIGGTTVTADATTAPDGTTTADTLIPGAASSPNNGVYELALSSVDIGGSYTWSVYGKEAGYGGLSIQADTVSANDTIFFDLTLGTILATGSNVTGSIEDAGNGWYRCIVHVASATTGDTRLYVGPVASRSGTGFSSYAGDTTSGVHLHGAQLEQGSTATAYIPTTTAVASSGFDTAITPTGLLVEEARANLCLQSEDFSTTWFATNDAIASDAGNAPDGTLTADRLDVTAATSNHWSTQAITTVSGTTYTYSCYIKNDGVDFVGISSADAAENFISVLANLTTGAISSTDVGTNSGTIVNSGIDDVGNGWYRLWMTGSHTGVGTTFFYVYTAHIAAPTFSDVGTVSYLGVDGEDVLMWGAQVEAAGFKTSYIPTTTASVTRNADNVDTTDISWFDNANVSQVTWYGDGQQHHEDHNLASYLFSLDNNSTSGHYIAVSGTGGRTGQANGTIREGGNLDQVGSGNDDAVMGARHRVAFSWLQDDFLNLAVDGVLQTPVATDVDPSTTLLTFAIGRAYNEGSYWNGVIKELRCYDTRITDGQLEDISNGIFPSFERRVKLIRDLTAKLLRGLARSLMN
jgi:hypothetical protein